MMAIKVLELVNGHTIICEITATVVPVREDGSEMEPILYIKHPAEILVSFDYVKGIHRVHIVEWMAYLKEKPDYISSTMLAFKPAEPDDEVLQAYNEKVAFDVLSMSNNDRNDEILTVDEENYEKFLD